MLIETIQDLIGRIFPTDYSKKAKKPWQEGKPWATKFDQRGMTLWDSSKYGAYNRQRHGSLN